MSFKVSESDFSDYLKKEHTAAREQAINAETVFGENNKLAIESNKKAQVLAEIYHRVFGETIV